jgi:deoxyribonuclease (pyrimidine dimer)
MTRINVVPVSELSNKHLVAEYREIARLPGNLMKSLTRKSRPFSKTEIPNEYVLGPGHVKFFYDKMQWLGERFRELWVEMINRGYDPQFRDNTPFLMVPSDYFGYYHPTPQAIELNRQRIKERTK